MAEKMDNDNQFTFAISLSVLNHLGRNLYRSFVTVLGEAVSNSWDADANSVEIVVNRERNSFTIRDDGDGMSRDDFQSKFLKIGYSKRQSGETESPGKKRRYIGRKGIGKLALLSCADRITVMSRTAGGEYVGGTINNAGLDNAIRGDLTPDQYTLEKLNPAIFSDYIEGHDKGTLVCFENMREGINKSSDYLRKLLALYFRFSLLDESFCIRIDGEEITTSHLKDLGEKTQFLWKIDGYEDPFIRDQVPNLKEQRTINVEGSFTGFIASVVKPSHLKVISTEEKVTVDLFANGRLRERDVLKYIPSARIVENYLYGQIHYDGLDDEVDRFSSSREGIVAEDPKFAAFLASLRDDVLSKIIEDWDVWRLKHRQSGDSENTRMSLKERKSLELYNSVSQEYSLPEGSQNRQKVNDWIDDLADDAKYNFGSYAECFISENLIRKYIGEKAIKLSPEAERDTAQLRAREAVNKKTGNCNIDLRQQDSDVSYLDMADLASLVDKQRDTQNCLPTDAKAYKPIRDALMHTALLTDEAKRKLTTIYDNIKGRVIALLST